MSHPATSWSDEQYLLRQYASIYKLLGFPPPDSIDPVECSCGNKAIMDRHAWHKDHRRVYLTLKCAECGELKEVRFKKPIRFNIPNPFRKKIVLSAVTLVSFVAIGFTAFKLNWSSILREGGPKAALEELRKAPVRDAFGEAWNLFAIGEYERAEAMCGKLISSTDARTKTVANTHYLLGLLKTKRMDPSALDDFAYAIETYSELDLDEKIPQVYLAIAKYHLNENDPDLAENYLHKATPTLSDPVRRAHFFDIESRVAFGRQDWAAALLSSEEKLKSYEAIGDNNGIADALSDVGIYLALMGNYDLAMEKSFEAQERIVLLGQEHKYYYNLLNLIRVRHCQGMATDFMIATVKKKVRETGNIELDELLALMIELECPAVFQRDAGALFPQNLERKESGVEPTKLPTQPIGDGVPPPPQPKKNGESPPPLPEEGRR